MNEQELCRRLVRVVLKHSPVAHLVTNGVITKDDSLHDVLATFESYGISLDDVMLLLLEAVLGSSTKYENLIVEWRY